MLGFAARAMGYRVVVLDPDPECPAAAIADRVVPAAYDSVAGAVELARHADVVTYELEHVDAALVDAVEAAGVPVRPGARALRMTQDRLAERRFVAGLGIATAPWREVADETALRAAAAELGTPLRLKAPIGGYDGRSQVRIGSPGDVAGAIERLGRPAGTPLLVERELDYEAELSVITARAPRRLARRVPHRPQPPRRGDPRRVGRPGPDPRDGGRRRPRRSAPGSPRRSTRSAWSPPSCSCCATGASPSTSWRRGSTTPATGRSKAPGRASSSSTSGRSAGCRSATRRRSGRRRWSTCSGPASSREARLEGTAGALADPLVHLHVYDKRQVFERRKMGHLTVAGAADVEEGLARGRAALARLRWA